MASRVHRREDPQRTDLLALDELFVIKGVGSERSFHAWRYDPGAEECPLCRGKIKNQDRFSHTYVDCVSDGSAPHIIELVYEFYKYRCQNPDCRHIFAPEIAFADVNSNVTYRLENRIAAMVIDGQSYGSIASSFNGMLTRQAVGQIFNRWVRSCNERRTMAASPAAIGAITGQTDKGEYTLIFSCDDGIRVLDILLGIDSDRITASLRRFSGGNARYILTDCDPTVYAAAKEALPKALHIIPAEMWLKLVRKDFVEFAHDPLKWLSVRNKQSLLLEPSASEAENMSPELKRIFNARPELEEPYHDYHYLRAAIFDRQERWHIGELDEWPDTLDDAFREQLSATLIQYREYRAEIARHEDHPEVVPLGLLSQTDRLEELIRTRRCFSEEVLQAMVLYSAEADLANWQGIRIEEITAILYTLPMRSRRKEYDDE